MYVDIFTTANKYDVIYADPPWHYKLGNSEKWQGAAANHYPTMKQQDIFDLPVERLAANNCVLFLWATFPAIKQGLATIRAWGFEYKTIGFNWVKRNKKSDGWFWGMGFWTRSNAEICLLGTRGKPQRESAAVHSVIDTPIGRHSEKPQEARERIVQLMGAGTKRIELFARDAADGWDCWGNEVEPCAGGCLNDR